MAHIKATELIEAAADVVDDTVVGVDVAADVVTHGQPRLQPTEHIRRRPVIVTRKMSGGVLASPPGHNKTRAGGGRSGGARSSRINKEEEEEEHPRCSITLHTLSLQSSHEASGLPPNKAPPPPPPSLRRCNLTGNISCASLTKLGACLGIAWPAIFVAQVCRAGLWPMFVAHVCRAGAPKDLVLEPHLGANRRAVSRRGERRDGSWQPWAADVPPPRSWHAPPLQIRAAVENP